MSKEQIEEMAKDLDSCPYIEEPIGCNKHDGSVKIAEYLYNAGYRKQSEVEWIWMENGTEDYEQYWLCSCCNNKSYWKSKFCEECGAKMKREAKGFNFQKEEPSKKYLSPEEVRKMSPKEVRDNYTAIMNSMKEWK